MEKKAKTLAIKLAWLEDFSVKLLDLRKKNKKFPPPPAPPFPAVEQWFSLEFSTKGFYLREDKKQESTFII